MKKILLGEAGVTNKGVLICKRNEHADTISCKTCDGFDYYGKPQNLRKVGTYTGIDISPNNQITIEPDEEDGFFIFGLPLECEEPDLVDVKKREKILSCRHTEGGLKEYYIQQLKELDGETNIDSW